MLSLGKSNVPVYPKQQAVCDTVTEQSKAASIAMNVVTLLFGCKAGSVGKILELVDCLRWLYIILSSGSIFCDCLRIITSLEPYSAVADPGEEKPDDTAKPDACATRLILPAVSLRMFLFWYATASLYYLCLPCLDLSAPLCTHARLWKHDTWTSFHLQRRFTACLV